MMSLKWMDSVGSLKRAERLGCRIKKKHKTGFLYNQNSISTQEKSTLLVFTHRGNVNGAHVIRTCDTDEFMLMNHQL